MCLGGSLSGYFSLLRRGLVSVIVVSEVDEMPSGILFISVVFDVLRCMRVLGKEVTIRGGGARVTLWVGSSSGLSRLRWYSSRLQ